MAGNTFKQFVSAAFPNVYRNYQQAYGNYGIPDRLQKAIVDKHGCQVLSGPFTGMNYVTSSVCSSYWPKLLGSYEAEIHPWISEIIATPYQTILDVGCAEGYYAVGLATRMPACQVLAFDTDEAARNLCEELARLNHVGERVMVKGLCDAPLLSKMSLEQTLLICDCEGYELELLNPEIAPSLQQCDILVELHDLFIPGITPTILARFGKSHTIRLIDAVIRNPEQYAVLHGLRPNEKHAAVDEARPGPMQWAFMTTKSKQ